MTLTGLGSDSGSRAIPVSNAPMAIVVWVRLIMALLQSSESRATWAELLGYRINRVSICKNDTMNEHEYVIIDLSRLGQKDNLFLRLERAAGERKITSPSPSPSTTTILSCSSGLKKFSSPPSPGLSPSPTSTSLVNDGIATIAGSFRRAVRRFTDPPLSRPSGISSNKYFAADTVEKLDGFPKSATIVRTVTFNSNDPSKRPSLWDLLVLAYAIHEDSMTYELFEKQCFWFADMISAVLEKWSESTGDIAVINREPTRSRLLRRNKRSGSVGFFVVHRRDPDLVDKIWGKFREKQDEFNNKRHEYEAARTEELRRAEDLARQVEELRKQQEDTEREFRRQLLAKEHEWQLRLQQREKENNQRIQQMEQLVRQRKQHATKSQ